MNDYEKTMKAIRALNRDSEKNSFHRSFTDWCLMFTDTHRKELADQPFDIVMMRIERFLKAEVEQNMEEMRMFIENSCRGDAE